MRKPSILIVEDEENVLKLLCKVLEKEGFEVHKATNGSVALPIIDKSQIDIVITDIRMPVMGGIELLKHLRKIDDSIKVILITAFATVETAIEALRVGASDYIIKPFDLDEIIFSIRKLTQFTEESGNYDSIDITQAKHLIRSKSKLMKEVYNIIKQVADTNATVMLYGETGTGKERAAQAIHYLSRRKDKPFIKINCAAIPENLLESELFGYEKGAFTGASYAKPGRFELADDGTLFLDEIGDISPAVQVKLLRALQEREFERLGGVKTLKIDVRIIAATNKNLEKLVASGQFREDLYYRLNVIPVNLPSLRERKEDIPDMIDEFLINSSSISRKQRKEVTNEAMQKLVSYDWPGNIRELENIIERCVVISSGDSISIKDLPQNILQFNPESENPLEINKLEDAVDTTEKEMIIKLLRECNGNRTKASEKLGISRRSLHRKINKYNIDEK